MDIQPAEKVYVAVGNDLQDGLCSLSWTIRNWSSQSISIVILHVNNTSQDFVYTPFGKLPSSSINDEKLGVLKMCEQEKIDKLLTKFISFCTKYKVQAEILKIGKADEPIHRVVVGLMSKYRITKLVMGITFIRSLSRKAKSSTGGSFYVHKNKPEFCELYIICGEKLVHLREENDEGKVSLKGWFGKMLAPNNYHSTQYVEKDYVHDHVVPFENRDWWKNFAEEIEIYSQWLLLNSTDEEEKDEKEEICKEDQEVDGDSSSIIPNSSLKLIEQIKADPNMVDFMPLIYFIISIFFFFLNIVVSGSKSNKDVKTMINSGPCDSKGIRTVSLGDLPQLEPAELPTRMQRPDKYPFEHGGLELPSLNELLQTRTN